MSMNYESCTCAPGCAGPTGPRPLLLRRFPPDQSRPGSPPPVGGAMHQRHSRQRDRILFRLYLKCVFCQNYPLSHENFGKEISTARLAEIFLELQEKGAHNINLVTATQYLPSIRQALELARPELHIPVVYNSGGYERTETIREFSDCIDIWLPDLKYYDSSLSEKYSAAQNYFSMASKAIKEMIRISGGLAWDRKTRGF